MFMNSRSSCSTEQQLESALSLNYYVANTSIELIFHVRSKLENEFGQNSGVLQHFNEAGTIISLSCLQTELKEIDFQSTSSNLSCYLPLHPESLSYFILLQSSDTAKNWNCKFILVLLQPLGICMLHILLLQVVRRIFEVMSMWSSYMWIKQHFQKNVY